jgi:glutaredoxin
MRFLIAAALTAAMSSAAAQVYRWTDASGKTHFTDTPPPASAKDVHKRRGASGAEQDDSDNSPEPYVLQHARKNYPVKLYSTPGCGPACDEARALLNARGVPFSEVSVSNDLTIAELKEVSGSTAVPVLLVGTSVQKGFEQGAYHRSLDAAGYPKTGILPRRSQAEPKQLDTSEAQPAAEVASPRGPYAPRFR